MSVYKGLNRSDVYLTDYVSKRPWFASGTNLAELGVRVMIATSGSRPYYDKEEDYRPYVPYTGTVGTSSVYPSGTYNGTLLYGSIVEQFYTGSLGDGTFTGSANWSLPTTLTISESRVINPENFRDADLEFWIPEEQKNKEISGVIVISIPKEVFGTAIQPNSFKIDNDASLWCYVEDDYMEHPTGSYCDEGYPEGVWTRESDHWVDPYFEDLHVSNIRDFEGVVIADGFLGKWHWPDEYRYPTPIVVQNFTAGDIIYAQGLIILTNPFLRYLLANWDVGGFEWKSSKEIYTKHVLCKVRDIDFNRTFNPTATEELQNTAGFTPYVTAVGLYNTRGDLLAVAKLSKPIKKALDTEMTFDLQIDLG